MKFLSSSPLALFVGVLGVLAAGYCHAQQPRRQFAPGVLTTISPAPQAEEMFSGPVPLVA